MQKDKRGISAVIASVLIIILVVVAVSIIWVVVPMFKETGTSFERQDAISVIEEEGYTVYYPDNGLASVQVKKGQDNNEFVPATGALLIFLSNQKGQVKEQKITIYINLSSFEIFAPALFCIGASWAYFFISE